MGAATKSGASRRLRRRSGPAPPAAAQAARAHRFQVFEQIVAAIDGSGASFDAALLASRFAALGGGTVHLFCAREQLERTLLRRPRAEAGPLGGAPNDRDPCELSLASARAAIGGRAVTARETTREGPAADAVLRFGEEIGADLVCVGAGRHPRRLGSVADRLLRRATVPVALVREGAVASPGLQRILAGIDGSGSAARAAALAARLAARAGAELQLVTVLPNADLPPEGVELDDPAAAPFLHGEEGAGLRAAREEATRLGARPTSARFVAGAPSEEILRAGLQWSADLVVVGTGRHRLGARRLLGGTAERIVSRAPRPVLVVR